jgi:nitric oxide synthase oxygenase domain/subunit
MLNESRALVDLWTAIRRRYGDEGAKLLVEDTRVIRAERQEREESFRAHMLQGGHSRFGIANND